MGTSSVFSSRSLHLVDLENLVGDPFAPARLVHDTLARYLTAAAWVAGDQVIVASNSTLIRKVAFDMPVPCNMHAAHGRDGADEMLLSLASAELVANRYARLVIGSGDHIFSSRAQAARDLGAQVLVVARAGWLLVLSVRVRPRASSDRMTTRSSSSPRELRRSAVSIPTGAGMNLHRGARGAPRRVA